MYEHLKAVEDPRSPRVKKHELATVLTYVIAGYVTGHTSLRRCQEWCKHHINWLSKQGVPVGEGIASLSTISRLLSKVDELAFLYVFIEWIGEIVKTRGAHLAVDGKALRAATEKCRGKHAPMLLNVVEATTGLVLAQLSIPDKESEITNISQILSLLDIEGSTVTADALNTQTRVMEQILEQGGHFVMMVKKNHQTSYAEIVMQFEAMERNREYLKKHPGSPSLFPEYDEKYDEIEYKEKNRGRYEYRNYRIINAASFVSRTEEEWPFLNSVGYVKQTRILVVRDKDGNDVTPTLETFLKKGSVRQPVPEEGDKEKADIQIVGIISDKEMTAEEMGRYKRNHWSVENRLHHVLDDTFREDRSPAMHSAEPSGLRCVSERTLCGA